MQPKDIIKFGKYNWTVLDVKEDRALLLCNKVFPSTTFHKTVGPILWEKSDIRKFLNNKFIKRFKPDERERILEVKISNDPNPIYRKHTAFYQTFDRVFLLSFNEISQYFAGFNQGRELNKLAEAEGDIFGKNNAIKIKGGARRRRVVFQKGKLADVTNTSIKFTILKKRELENPELLPCSILNLSRKPGKQNYDWWLRTVGRYPSHTCVVRADGMLDYEGTLSCIGYTKFRPAMWIKIENDQIEDNGIKETEGKEEKINE